MIMMPSEAVKIFEKGPPFDVSGYSGHLANKADDIARLYIAGFTTKEIARAFYTTKVDIRYVLWRTGWRETRLGEPKHSYEDRDWQIFSTWQGRKHPTLSDFGEMFGISPERVRQIYYKYLRRHVAAALLIDRKVAAEQRRPKLKVTDEPVDGYQWTPELQWLEFQTEGDQNQ